MLQGVGEADSVPDTLDVRHREELPVGVLVTDIVKDWVRQPLLVRETLGLVVGEGDTEGEVETEAHLEGVGDTVEVVHSVGDWEGVEEWEEEVQWVEEWEEEGDPV